MMSPDNWPFLFASDRVDVALAEVNDVMTHLIQARGESCNDADRHRIQESLMSLLTLRSQLTQALVPVAHLVQRERQQFEGLPRLESA